MSTAEKIKQALKYVHDNERSMLRPNGSARLVALYDACDLCRLNFNDRDTLRRSLNIRPEEVCPSHGGTLLR